VPVSVVRIGQVRMVVHQRCVLVRVRVGLGNRLLVGVRVMLVVHVRVLVLYGLVLVAVRVMRADDDRDPDGHERACGEVSRRQMVVKERDRDQRADEGGRREVGGLPRGSERTNGE